MAYTLCIERPGNPISLSEWMSVASRVPCVRAHIGDNEAINPETLEKIRLASTLGDLDVQTQEGWIFAIRFSGGKGQFNAPKQLESVADPVRRAATMLAKELNASIIGDEGETYSW